MSLKVDCSKVTSYITLEEIDAVNMKITEPEKFEDNYEASTELTNLFDVASEKSGKYKTGHENDTHGKQQYESIENLMETDFYYKCRENNDLTYLAAVLMHRITQGHPYEEGNKRTSYVAACIYLMKYQFSELGMNKASIPRLDYDLLDALEDVADNQNVEPEDIESIFKQDFLQKIREINSNR